MPGFDFARDFLKLIPLFSENGAQMGVPLFSPAGRRCPEGADEGAAQPHVTRHHSIKRNPQPLYHLALRFAPPSSGPADHLLPAGEKRERNASATPISPLAGETSERWPKARNRSSESISANGGLSATPREGCERNWLDQGQTLRFRKRGARSGECQRNHAPLLENLKFRRLALTSSLRFSVLPRMGGGEACRS